MKTLRAGGMQEVSSLKNRVSRALGKNEIPKSSHDVLWDLLEQLEQEIISPTREEASCQHQESSQSSGSESEPG